MEAERKSIWLHKTTAWFTTWVWSYWSTNGSTGTRRNSTRTNKVRKVDSMILTGFWIFVKGFFSAFLLVEGMMNRCHSYLNVQRLAAALNAPRRVHSRYFFARNFISHDFSHRPADDLTSMQRFTAWLQQADRHQLTLVLHIPSVARLESYSI